MQDQFNDNPQLLEKLKKSLSAPRYQRYLDAAEQDESKALNLYRWNARISQSLYVYIQCWEIGLRNKLNDFLIWKHNEKWPYDQKRAIRGLKSDDQRRLQEVKDRKQRELSLREVPTSPIVADLTAGFWVSQLSTAYDVPYSWRYNISRIFPNEKIERAAAWELCDQVLLLRNRVAHHEPVFHLPLSDRQNALKQLVLGMCEGLSTYAESNCTFREIWDEKPDFV